MIKKIFAVVGLVAIGWFGRDLVQLSYTAPKSNVLDVLPQVSVSPTASGTRLVEQVQPAMRNVRREIARAAAE